MAQLRLKSGSLSGGLVGDRHPKQRDRQNQSDQRSAFPIHQHKLISMKYV